MADVTVACPSCSTSLRSAAGLRAGKRVRCPRCATPFVVPEGAFAPDAIQPAPPANRALLLGLVFGGVLLLAGASVGLAMLVSGSSNSPARAEAKPDPEKKPTPDPNADGPRPDRLPPREERDPPPPPKKDDAPKKEDPPSLTALPAEEQARVNKAVDKGVEHLKKAQNASGLWARAGATHAIGLNALPALTLLECGVPGDDPSLRKAIAFVRKEAPGENRTYEIALAILLLDRLGDPQDEALIQSLGLRLIGGQTRGGGWTYTCTWLNAREEKSLQSALEMTRPLSSRDLFLTEDGGDPGGKGGNDPKGAKGDAAVVKPEDFARAAKNLPAALREVPAVQPPNKLGALPATEKSDNSNTQFGLLGVWVAGRHQVPTERALALVTRRFRENQNSKGGWRYSFLAGKQTLGPPSMTAAGLLGLAVGHGLDAGEKRDDGVRKKVDDPAIKKALTALSEYVEKPLGKGRVTGKGVLRTDVNLYFLWSLERVGVLYNARTLDGKDWYHWGAELLVDHQNADGGWTMGGYPGSVALTDTSFALLFLKRANLVKDLSSKLDFVIDSSK